MKRRSCTSWHKYTHLHRPDHDIVLDLDEEPLGPVTWGPIIVPLGGKLIVKLHRLVVLKVPQTSADVLVGAPAGERRRTLLMVGYLQAGHRGTCCCFILVKHAQSVAQEAGDEDLPGRDRFAIVSQKSSKVTCTSLLNPSSSPTSRVRWDGMVDDRKCSSRINSVVLAVVQLGVLQQQGRIVPERIKGVLVHVRRWLKRGGRASWAILIIIVDSHGGRRSSPGST